MRRRSITLAAAFTFIGSATPAFAQVQPTWAVNDPVLKAIWTQGMEQSQVMRTAQTLMDSVGPRLTGSPGHKNAVDWAVGRLKSWGIDARAEQYGTWNSWRRGVTHIDLVSPRVRTLEGMMLAWSPGTGGRPVEGAVVAMPAFNNAAEYNAWLATVRGKHVATSFPQPSCRPLDHYTTFGQTYGGGGGGRGGAPGAAGANAPANAAERLTQERNAAQTRFNRTNTGTQGNPGEPIRPGGGALRTALENAGAVGILESQFSADLGVIKIFDTNTTRIPTVALSCEDYGLVYRLAANNQGPVVRVSAESENLGELPVYNVVGTIRGTQLPNEYVMFSAHYDSWDGSSGATDNGTGSAMLLEAMRILKQVYPNPKRTIMIGLWGGEEQGLNGSRRFVGMHPEVVSGLQALFNQDNGTGRITSIGMQGLVNAAGPFATWMSRMPTQITQHITLGIPGSPGGGGSDYASFICAGAPAFSLGAISWDYSNATWHTNRDTYDKVVEEELRNNATLAAMLAYLASEHPEKLSRERRIMPAPANAAPGATGWPTCTGGAASSTRPPR